MGTFVIDGSTADGFLEGVDASYANVRGGGASSNAVDTATATAYVGQDVPGNYQGWEGFLDFDPAAVAGTVVAVTLALNVAAYFHVGSTFTLEARLFDYGASLTYADWRHYITELNAGNDPLMASLASTSFTVGTRQDLTSQAAFITAVQNAINGATHVRLVLCTDRQSNGGSVPTGSEYCQVSTANESTAGLRPQLTVVTAGGGMQMLL